MMNVYVHGCMIRLKPSFELSLKLGFRRNWV